MAFPARSNESIKYSKPVKLAVFRELTPGPFHSEALRQQVRNVIHRTQTKMKNLFERTVETWETRVDWDVKESTAGGIAYAEVSTDNELYYLVDHGVEPHTIPMNRNWPTLVYQRSYTAKTAPGVIDSQASFHGGGYARPVEVVHQGFDPRDFDETIRDIVDDDFQEEAQKALDDFARRSGHHMPSRGIRG